MARVELVVFDLDGTLIDSDAALVAPFLALGVPRDEISFGHPIEVECRRLGIDVLDYVAHYDTDVVEPYPGVVDMLAHVERWAVCSNKHPVSGLAELDRLRWQPEIALFADAFDGRAKELVPVLEAARASAEETLFVGDTSHDQRCAIAVGCAFAWAGWNPRTAATRPEGTVLAEPGDVLGLLGG